MARSSKIDLEKLQKHNKEGTMRVNTNVFVARLNWAFGPPFLPGGFFQADVAKKGRKKGLSLKIGDRDACFDMKGIPTDSGTNVGKGRVWEIKRKKIK